MIVHRIGYLNFRDVLNLGHFSIYETKKKTVIVVKDTSQQIISLSYPKKDRLPWKDVEGKKITTGKKIFDSKVNDVAQIDLSRWNNGNQIMVYEEFSITKHY